MANLNSCIADTIDGEDTEDRRLCSVRVAPPARVEQDVPGPVKRQSVELEIAPMRGQRPHIVAAVAGIQRTPWLYTDLEQARKQLTDRIVVLEDQGTYVPEALTPHGAF